MRMMNHFIDKNAGKALCDALTAILNQMSYHFKVC